MKELHIEQTQYLFHSLFPGLCYEKGHEAAQVKGNLTEFVFHRKQDGEIQETM